MGHALDRIDLRILTELQADATIPIAELAARVGLSQTPCWKRVRKLEAAGVISRRAAIVDPARVGLGLTVLVEIAALDHTAAWREQFTRVASGMPEVMEVMRLGGTSDYMLRVIVADVAAYDAIYRKLTAEVPLRSVTSKFVMETLWTRTALPL